MDTLNFLPVSKEDMENRGWWYYDFLVVTADAYIDHPSFGTAIIARVLEEYHGQEEEERCRELAERLAAQKGRDRKALQSVQRTLLARGFGYDLIRQALAGLGEEGERD